MTVTKRELEHLGIGMVDLYSAIKKAEKEGTPWDRESAEQIDAILEPANQMMRGYGVESIDSGYDLDSHDEVYVNSYYRTFVALYVNMGDTYVTTLLYDIEQGEFFVASWGDWFEEWEREHPPEVSEHALDAAEDAGYKWAEDSVQGLLEKGISPNDWPDRLFDGSRAEMEAHDIASGIIRNRDDFYGAWCEKMTEKILDAADDKYAEIMAEYIEEGVEPEPHHIQKYAERKGQKKFPF